MARPRFDSRVYRRGLPGDVDAPGFGHRYSCKAGAPAPAEPAGVSHGTATGKQDPRPCAGGVGWAGAPPRRLPGDRGAAGDPVARRRSHRAPGRDHADPRQRLRAGRRLPPRRGHPHRPRAAPRDQLLHRPGAGRRPAVQRRERAPGRRGNARPARAGAALLHLQRLRGLRQGQPGRDRAARLRPAVARAARRRRGHLRPARQAPGGAGAVRVHRWPARRRPVHARRRAGVPARGRTWPSASA